MPVGALSWRNIGWRHRADDTLNSMRPFFKAGASRVRDMFSREKMVRSADAYSRLLSQVPPEPVLVDVGASGAPPTIWDSLARHSAYIGFDPDLREIREIPGGRYRRAIIV